MSDMQVIGKLPRGIPDGYAPQRQSAPSNGTVLVSEWARKAAHQLDDTHRDWVEARRKDEFADESPNAKQLRGAVDHVAMLSRWDWVLQYQEMVKREYHLTIAYLEHAKENKGYVGQKAVTMPQWSRHIHAVKIERAYLCSLLSTLKERSRQFGNEIYERREIVSDLDAAAVMVGIARKLFDALPDKKSVLTKEEFDAMSDIKWYVMRRSKEEASNK